MPTNRSQRVVAVLDSIRSAMNVGTMLRSADGFGIDHVYLCGLTADADNPKVIKTSLGAEATVATTRVTDVTACVADLRRREFAIWSIESTPTSVLLAEVVEVPPKLAFVVGNERAGVDPEILAASDQHVHLAMAGEKTSLNVGVVFGIVAHRVKPLASSDPI